MSTSTRAPALNAGARLALLITAVAVALVASSCGNEESVATPVPAAESSTGTSDTTEHHPDEDHPDEDHPTEHHPDALDTDGTEPADDSHDGDEHEHGDVVEFIGSEPPTIAVAVVADTVGGVNIAVTTANFTVAPRSASSHHVEGEGHFHLWVDGVKTTRFYTDWLHVPGVVEGAVELTVELSANDHRTYAIDGEPIAATVTFDVPAHEHAGHDHDVPDAQEVVGEPPVLSIEVLADPKSGYNAFVSHDGLEISAEQAGGHHVDGVGHLHIYVNEQKLGRLYGRAMHIPALPSGDVEITVRAFTNDHRPYTVDGNAVEATTHLTAS